MSRYVAFFRGINVGKAKRIAMADLLALFESLGYSSVRTLLNSGNVIFDADSATQTSLAATIQKSVADKLGVESSVIVKSAKEIAAIVSGNKLGDVATDPSRLLVAMTGDAKSFPALSALAKKDW